MKLLQVHPEDLDLAKKVVADHRKVGAFWGKKAQPKLEENNIRFTPRKVDNIILLDLNRTLAESCRWDYQRDIYFVQEDVYSKKLAGTITAIENSIVILATARPPRYMQETLTFIEKQLGSTAPDFKIDWVICKTNRRDRIAELKPKWMQTIVDRGIDIDMITAIESNADTRTNYKKAGLKNVYTREQFIKEKSI